jgi:protein TonB
VPQTFFALLQQIWWRCVMPVEPREVPETVPEVNLGSLSGCLVDGDAEQRGRERRARRGALAISVLVQSAILAVLVFISLFSKAESIALANVTPIPPYSPYRDVSHHSDASHNPKRPQKPCHFCVPPNISPTIVTHDPTRAPGDPNEPTFPGMEPGIPGAPNGFIPLPDSRRRVLPPDDPNHHATRPAIVHITRLAPAMLVHRVEPVYPALAKQIHKEGRVELRAIIGTDGTIQSLEIVAGDALFEPSAVEAVQQWRYRPTILNDQPVEIDTYITVIYTMPR